jgi:tryptophan-rich sensory protein
MGWADVGVLAIFVVACGLAAATGVLFPPGAFYERLRKPSWQPPRWVFAPVWTLLSILIAVAGWLVWRSGGPGIELALGAYALQLILNAAWTPLFFGLRRPDLALCDIVAMWLAIALTIALFVPISPLATLLLVPYLLWVSFASALNYAVWTLNGSRPAHG